MTLIFDINQRQILLYLRIIISFVNMKKIINPWEGVEGYMCFACSPPQNPNGLHMEFFEDEDDVVALWKPTKYEQGWLDTLHGGIQSTLMDEVAGWVIVRKLQTTGVTSRLEAKFMKSISTKEPQISVRGGRIKEQKRNAVFLERKYSIRRENYAHGPTSYILSLVLKKHRKNFTSKDVR